jgi:hypothetical protein
VRKAPAREVVPISSVAGARGAVHQNEKTPREAGPVDRSMCGQREQAPTRRRYRGLPASSMAGRGGPP